MAEISREEVQHLATLSSLALSDDEIDALGSDIGGIVDHIGALRDVDTNGVEPTYQVTDLEFVSRPDEVQDSGVTRETLLALANDSKDNQIKVPKVL